MKSALRGIMILAGLLLAAAAALCLLIGYWERVKKWLYWVSGALRGIGRRLRKARTRCGCCCTSRVVVHEDEVDASCFAD